MLQIDPLTRNDLAAAMQLSTQAGWNQIERDWLRLLDLEAEGCLAGRIDGRVVATATLVRYEPRLAWVGMVLVDSICRGQGFGAQIFNALLSKAKQLNIGVLGLDATDAGRPIYAKRGFAEVIGIDRRLLMANSRSSFAASAQRLGDGDWAGLLELDRTVLGIDRSRVLLRLLQESDCRVIHETGRITAFGFRRPGRLADQIGPIVTRSAAEAQILIESLAANTTSEPSRDLLLDSIRGGPLDGWLDSIGFAISRRLTRMICGDTGSATMSGPCVFAAAGLELG